MSFKKCYLFLCVFFVGLFFCQSFCSAETVTITFPAQSYVSGTVVKLGDIANVTGTDKNRVAVFRAAILGEAPTPGSSYVLDQSQMGAWLMATGMDFTGVFFDMPASIVIKATAQVVSGSVIKKAIEQAVKNEIGAAVDDITLQYYDAVNDEIVSGGKATVAVKLPGSIRFNSAVPITVSFVVDGTVFAKKSIRCDVSAFKEAFVAARNLERNAVLTKEDVKLTRVEILNVKNELVSDEQQLLGKVLKKAIAAGEPIVSKALTTLPVVKRGQAVIIIARSGELEISSAGTALQDGMIGQMIRVENTATKKQLVGKVVDGQTVVIEL